MPVSKIREKKENPGNIFLFTGIYMPEYEQRHPAQTGLINTVMKQMTNAANNRDL